jgi:4a-hydroxytetrahydrobiopterin dehydratase
MGDTLLTDSAITQRLANLPTWQVTDEAGTRMLSRSWRTKNFMQGMAFAQAIAQLAERADHHPRLSVEYRHVTASWWTHSAGGLTERDFTMAAETDTLFSF